MSAWRLGFEHSCGESGAFCRRAARNPRESRMALGAPTRRKRGDRGVDWLQTKATAWFALRRLVRLEALSGPGALTMGEPGTPRHPKLQILAFSTTLWHLS